MGTEHPPINGRTAKCLDHSRPHHVTTRSIGPPIKDDTCWTDTQFEPIPTGASNPTFQTSATAGIAREEDCWRSPKSLR